MMPVDQYMKQLPYLWSISPGHKFPAVMDLRPNPDRFWFRELGAPGLDQFPFPPSTPDEREAYWMGLGRS